MKILQVLPALEQGGSEWDAVELALALRTRGIENGIVSTGGSLVARVESAGVVHYELPVATKNTFKIIANAGRLARLVKTGGYDLVHVRSRAPAWSVRIAARLAGFPWVATYHGVYGTKPWWFKRWYNGTMLVGRKTICVSDFVKRHVESTYRPPAGQLVTISGGADTSRFRPDAVTPEAVANYKSTLGFAPEMPLVVMVGRLTRWKGQHLLLEAAAKLRHRRFGILFVGPDQGRIAYANELKALAAKLSDTCKVVFFGSCDEMPLVYASGDIVVSASSGQPEAFGRVIPEAQAMGRIVIGTAHGGACETIEDGKTGFLVPPGDADALAQKLDEVLDMTGEARDAMRAAAIRSVRENFSCEIIGRKTLALYREILNSQGEVPSRIGRIPFVGPAVLALCAVLGLDRKRQTSIRM